MIDLHLHSTASDGRLTPEQVMEKVHQMGFAAAALTDHDTQRGIAQASCRAAQLGLTFISGVEISAGGCPETHVLGYGIEPGAQPLDALLVRMQRARMVRMELFLKRLNQNGVRVSMDDVLYGGVSETTVGRPHLGRALVRLGYAQDLRDAFAKYLVRGCATFVEREKVTVAETVKTIGASGGVAVLAHPALLHLDWRAFENTLIYLVKLGAAGVECYHPTNTPQMAQQYREAAQRYGLLITGGSDFHGGATEAGKPQSEPGEGLESFFDADRQVQRLLEAIDRRRRGLSPLLPRD